MKTGIFLFIFLTSIAFADGPVKSFKSAMEHTETGDLYVAVGYPKNHEGYEARLNRLWDEASQALPEDSFHQKWKRVTPGDLISVFGHFDRQYYLVYPRIKRVKDNNFIRSEFDGYELEQREVVGAALFRWGCDDSVIPVLNLGPWPPNTRREWGPMAISVHGKFSDARLIELDKELVPRAYSDKVANTEKWLTIEWPTLNYRATMTYHTYATGEAFQHIFATGDSPGYFSFLSPGGPMDVAC